MKIDCKITSRFAHTIITSQAVNRANVSKEALFDVELPKTAFITNFVMTIDGVSYPGIIKEKEAAQQQYQKAVSRGQTAGLVKASGRKTEKFSVSVNIAAAKNVTFELNYEELLKRSFGKYELLIKVNPKQLVKQFEIEANIFEPQGISYLDAEASFITNDLLPVMQKSFSGKKVHFKPTLDQQRSCADCPTTLLNGDFVIKYDVNRETPGNIQIVNGYFVHFFAPKNITRLSKNIVFIIDVSISMSGRKLEQTKQALLKILEDIKEDDYLNFVLFGSDVHKWKDTLIQATPENLEEARRYVRDINIAGWTNLNGGLLAGIEMLNEAQRSGTLPERSASLIIMLTDGRPTKGETNTQTIIDNVRNAIQGKYPLYNLGFGYDLDYASLEKMAAENNGLARRIYEDSDSDLQLQGFYDEVANPLLTEVELKYPENAISDLTQNNFKHYYDGSEIVVAGRITDNDLNSITAEVTAHGVSLLLDLPVQHEVWVTSWGTWPKPPNTEAPIHPVDPTTGIIVNGQLIGDVTTDNDAGLHNTYIGRLGIINTQLNLTLEVTPEKIVLHNGTKQKTFILTLKIIRKKSLEVSLGEGATFEVVLHKKWKKHLSHADFLGFYIMDSHRLSENTHGLLGQFLHPIDFNILEVHPGSDPEKPDATMIVKNNQLTVTRGWQKDYTEDTKRGTNVPCWFIHNNAEGLIDGTYTDYVVPSLF
uniref:Inter-alpha-trypsin inhibitor heavy chain H3 n=1 Tax=Varanus komodoensis TaxID=61221 RepID=A0A8D2LSS5_VARKO